MATSSLLQLRRALGGALDDLRVDTVVASTTSTITSPGFQDQTPNASANAYDGRWLYIATGPMAGNQRRVQAGGLSPATGLVALHLGMAVAPAPGSELELTAHFPCVEQVGTTDTSYRTIINRGGLGKLAVPDRLELPITTLDRYPLSQPWLDRPARLTGILEPGVRGGRATDAGWRGWRLVADAGGYALEVDAPYSTASGSLILEVLRPVQTLVNGVESTVGLFFDTDTVPISVEDALPAMLASAYYVLMGRSPGRPGADYAARFAEQLERAQASRWWDRTLEVEQAPQPTAAPSGRAA